MFRKLFRRGSRRTAPADFHPDRPPPGPCPYDAPPPDYSKQDALPASDAKQTKETKEANWAGEAPSGPLLALEPFADDDGLPPPAFHALYRDSPTSDAPAELAEAGWDFIDAHALAPPRRLSPAALAAIQAGALELAPPPSRFHGTIAPTSHPTIGAARGIAVASAPDCPDTCLLSALPLYAAGYAYPLHTGRAKAVYFEVTVQHLPEAAAGAIALGFCALPYPGFRLPGWNRGSLAVHTDDGRRFANDSYGGKTFLAQPVRTGETLGIGMRWAPGEGGVGVDVDVWVTRGGVCVGGWQLDEPRDRDEENDPLPGLDGACDVYAAVGVWGGPVVAHLQFFADGYCPAMPP